MKKYNIALLPLNMTNTVIRYSETLVNMADKYRLGKNSLPHVTLYQFYTAESEIASIWNKVAQEFEGVTVELSFENVSCTTSDNITFWVALMPDKKSFLTEMHKKVAALINHPVKENFDPHMTLINSKNRQDEKVLVRDSTFILPLRDLFVMAIGECDHVGQYIKNLYSLSNR